MSRLLVLFNVLMLSSSLLVRGQGNYVANRSNSTTPGTFNTLVGPGAGAGGSLTGDRNVVMGYNAGIVLTTGRWNTFAGVDAGRFTTSGSYNTFIGKEAGLYNSTGYANSFMGQGAGYSNTTGYYNAFVGYQVGYANTSGNANVFMGAYSGSANTTGSNNSFIGYFAGHTNTTGSANSFFGTGAGEYNTSGFGNSFTGYAAGFMNTTGSSNSFTGYGAGQSNTTGNYNVFMGGGAAIYNSTGSQNVFLGNDAGYFSIGGSQNTFLGYQSGYYNSAGSNTFLGYQTGFDNTTGSGNIAIGQNAGSNNQTGSNNIFIGVTAKAGTVNPTNLTNAVAIGANAVVSQNNSMVLGSGLNVGIGTSTPSTKLHITSGVANNSGLRLENLTSSSPATLLNKTKFLSVDANGNVVMASVNGSARVGAESDLWITSGEHMQNANTGGVIIGPGISKTPTGYRLYVADGILTEKVKVAIKNIGDWSDKVFESGYKLRSLREVEQYVNQTGHLPGVPSASEVLEKGIDLGKMDAKLLEKVEELTLYNIQLEKDNRQQRIVNQQQAQELRTIKEKQARLEQLLQEVLNRK